MTEKTENGYFLYNIAPNGLKVDQVYLTSVMNLDDSGIEYYIEYVEDFSEGDRISIGHCDLTMGYIRFDALDENAYSLGVNSSTIKLIVDWIQENMEPME